MKTSREQVHAKYDGHCAYCGKVIAITVFFIKNETKEL